MRPRQVAAELARAGICAWDGDYYARELFDALGVNETGGAVRLGLMHYNTADEVGRLIDAVAGLRPRQLPATSSTLPTCSPAPPTPWASAAPAIRRPRATR